MNTLTVRVRNMPKGLWEDAKLHSVITGIPVWKIVVEALRAYLETT